jgi:AcrR family transcriptional regulator
MTTADATRVPQPGRLERRKARTRAAILDAASRLFHERGYEETSIQTVAEGADTGVGTLYGYFASKEDILRAVLEAQRDEAVARYHSSVAGDTPSIDRLEVALSTLAEYITANRGILLAAFHIGRREGGDDQPLEWLVTAYKMLIADGIARQSLARVPVDTTARCLVGTWLMALLGIGIWKGRENSPETLSDLRALTRQLLAQG